MYDFFQVGQEVIFQSLSDIRLIVEGINETNGGVRCKYFDENLNRYIKLTLPPESLIPHKNTGGKKKPPFSKQ
jgi:hypothetical protein